MLCVHAFGHLELAGLLAVGAVGAADPGEAVAQGLLWEATEGTADLATPADQLMSPPVLSRLPAPIPTSRSELG